MNDYGTRKTDSAVKRTESRLSRVYHQAARDIEDKLKDWQKGHERREAMYRQQLAEGKITQADFDAWMRGQVFQEQQWKARQQQINEILLNADKEAARIVNEGKLGVFADNANYMGYELEHGAGVNTSFTLYDQNTVARLIKDDPQILPKAQETVKKEKAFPYYNKLMNSAITQGIVQGESIGDIARRVARTTGESSYKSALRNARTAYTGAQNAGRIEGLHQAQGLGINVKKKWMATLDDHTRDAHADLDGQVREIDEPFDSELGPIDYPGDPTADPANVYNCRCTLVYVYPDYPSDIDRRDAETGEVVGDMTYKEWAAWKAGQEEEETQYTVVGDHNVVDGHDISGTWERRKDEFAFEIEDVINAQGFDGTPRIVSTREFDSAVKAANGGKGFIAQRSYSAPDQETLHAYRQQLYEGNWYVDCGTGGAQYGQGMYCAADYTGTLSEGIQNEMEHYRELGENRYGNAQREYAQKVYKEEMNKVDFPLDDRYKNAFTDEMGITDMWTQGSEERKFVKDWISNNPEEANKLKEAYKKAQEIGVQKGMEIESLTKEQFKEKYPNIGARSYTETLTLAPDAKIVTWREINDIRIGNLDMDYRTREIERIVSAQGFTQDEATFVKYNLGTGVSWGEVDAAARRLTPERRNELVDKFYQIGEEATRRYNEEHDRRVERARIYQEKFHDIGSLAAALGYDAINAENHGQSGSYTVILNRTKCVFRRPD